MPNEEVLPETKVGGQSPQNFADFLGAHFGKMLFVLLLLLAAAFIPAGGSTILNNQNNGLVIGLAAFVLVFVVIPQFAFFAKRREIGGIYVPYDPEKENCFIEGKVERIIGGSVRINRILGEPEFGEKSSEPYVMHFQGTWTSQQGIPNPISFKLSLVSRSILSIEPKHTHLEDGVFSWGAFPKYPKTKYPEKLIYNVQKVAVKPKIQEEKQDEEEEQEGE